MRKATLISVVVLSIGWWVGSVYSGDEPKKQPTPSTPPATAKTEGEKQPEMKPVEVTPQHKVLHHYVGEWKVESKHWESPDGPPTVGYGKRTYRLALNGLALVCEIQLTSDQGDYTGMGITTWNTMTKKYDSVWVDNYCYNGIDRMDGVYDEATKTFTSSAVGTMPDGTKIPYRIVSKEESNDKIVEQFFMAGPDGKEFRTMEGTYTRVK